MVKTMVKFNPILNAESFLEREGSEIQGFAQAEPKLKAKFIIWNEGNKPKDALWKPVYDYCCSLGFCR